MASTSTLSRRPSSSEVFINFRGPDTRTNFVTMLYRALMRERIQTFIDSKELWEGEEICPSLLRAIRGSEISIPVISKSYAHSKYCLLELSEIWECHSSQGQTILPVFIDVEPRDVRHQTGSFEGPFQEYQEKYSSDVVERWKNALREVGKLKGSTLQGNATIEDQLNIVESIVRRASRELNNVPLDECRHPIGINSHIDILLPMLNVGSDDVRFVAICGMGGLGKTTIAKAVYNRIFTGFNGSSFLANVREEASQGDKGLVSLQNQLLRDILGKEQHINNASQGSKLIEKRFHREKVLLILDDINDYTQLDALARGINWFGEGSRVIITTRDEHCLKVNKADRDIKIYEPKGLNYENSLQLLGLHAFSMTNPPDDYTELMHEVVCHADGLPLILEVLGSFLCDKSKEEWEITLGGLKDIRDNKVSGMLIKSYEDKVFARLMISYNQLNDNAKIIFLDIACHFIGEAIHEITDIIELWEACELYPRLAIKELTQMHLLKIIRGRMSMHDELQFMGKRIVLVSSNGDHSKRIRLWSDDDISKVFENQKATQMVEGILLHDQMHLDDLRFDDFAKMPNLRFLRFQHKNSIKPITGDFSNLPSQLRWLHWCDPTLKIPPANFYHEELVHLNLLYSSINQAWNDGPQNDKKRFQKLKVLDLRYSCHFSVSSNFFKWFPCLQRLNLSCCRSLLQLPESICQMVSLKFLNLDFCLSLNQLPKSIGNLKQLVELLVCSTKIEELPDGVGQLEKLEKLDVSGCNKLARLPTSMGKLRRLSHLDLTVTIILKLPDDFSKLSCLEVLKMSMASQQDEIGDNRMLQPLQISESGFPFQLQELHLDGYMNLESLPRLPSTLTTLQVGNCNSLQLISNLSDLVLLQELSIYGCKSLVSLPDLSNLTRSKKFWVGCENLNEIHCIEGTKSLEELSVNYFPKLTGLLDLSNLKRLRKLRIHNVENLEKIHGFEGTELLEELVLGKCPNLRKLPDLSNLKKLWRLDVYDCENLEEIRGLEGIKSLKDLIVDNCNRLIDNIRGLEGTKSLEMLWVLNCHKLTQLFAFSNLKRLREVHIHHCINLENIQCIKGAESLECLQIVGCHKLKELPDISYLKRLSTLRIFDCINLENIHCFEGAQSLRYCTVTGCDKVTETRRKIVGQGRLLDDIVKGVKGSNPIVTGDRGSPILCIVFASRYRELLEHDRFEVYVHIHRQGVGRRIYLEHSIRVEDQSEFTSKGDIIYIHHFEGFDWFGFLLETNDTIEKLNVRGEWIEVKFCKVLFEDKDSKQQMPNKQSSAKLVADFFRWSDGNNDEVVEEEEGADEEMEEEERGLIRRWSRECCPDDENKTDAGPEAYNCFIAVKAVWHCFSNCFSSTGFLL